MNQPKRTNVLRVSVVILALVGMYLLGFGTAASINSGWIGQQITAIRFGQSKPSSVNFEQFWDVWNRVHRDFVSNADDQKLVDGAIKGMVNGLDDPYTVYLTPSEAKRFDEDVQGKFSGIGVEIGIRNKVLTIITPLDDSPGKAAGLKTGDAILKIDGKETGDMTIEDAVSRIRGEINTKVTLTVLPLDASETKEVEITRNIIEVKSVKWEMKGSIAYIRITQFSDDTEDLMKQAITDLQAKKPTGYVLDLRNNPGGYLQGAQDIASIFISPGVVVSKEGKDGQRTDLYTVGKQLVADTPMTVLVNGGSASASEIVAGAIQDRARGKIIGEKSFGKGSVQDVQKLVGGAELKITIAHWLTPNHRTIQGQGIVPDVEVKLTNDDAKANKDPQLDKAIELLQKK